MEKTIKDLADYLGGKVIGDDSLIISGVSGIKEAGKGDIAFLANNRYASLLNETEASAILIDSEFDFKNIEGKNFIIVDDPSFSFAKIVKLVAPPPVEHKPGISEKCYIADGVKLGKDVHIAPFAVIDKNAWIGSGTVICACTYIGQETKIGDDCLLYPNVSVRERIEIGSRVIIHSGAVVGSDGFGFSTIRGIHKKIPQIGTVFVEDDVEIGANVTIDRARFGKTVISKGTKIDNLVQIAHNVNIGENTIICAQTGIAGSTSIGSNVILAGQSGVTGHVNIADNAVIAGRAGVIRNIDKGETVSGFPAISHSRSKRIQIAMQKLPELLKKVSEMEKKIKTLEKKRKKN
ncbi:MAG: UDP-3-O-(3-hydroxymyristoyl)glucosamine N-acyltransferase [Candidatus Aureabacteria bacterium]|nr:UDP-3-O-(3-hydroxymyristoyl)glucosamine N-acyltransferase [Candidatus Auribacterota bacterium]